MSRKTELNVSRVGGKNAGASVFARDNYFSSNEKVTGKGECIRIRIEYLVLHFAQPYQLEQQHSDVAAVALRTHNQRPSQRNHLRDSMQKSVRETHNQRHRQRDCVRDSMQIMSPRENQRMSMRIDLGLEFL